MSGMTTDLGYALVDGEHVIHAKASSTISEMNLCSLLRDKLHEFSDRLLLVSGDTGLGLTGSEINFHASRVAACLVQQGLQKGDIVLVLCSNDLVSASIFLGVVFAGGVFAPRDTWCSVNEVASLVLKLEPRFLVCSQESMEPILSEIKKLDMRTGVGIYSQDSFSSPAISSILSTNALCKGFSMFGRIDADKNAASLVDLGTNGGQHGLYVASSSGSTGESKNLILTERAALTAVTVLNQQREESQQQSIELMTDNFAHSIGVWTLLGSLINGRQLVLQDFRRLVQSIPEFRIMSLWIQFSDAMRIVQSSDVTDFSSLQTVRISGTTSNASLMHMLRHKIGTKADVIFNYGTTESGPISETPAGLDCEDGCVGRLMPGLSLRITSLDDSDHVLALSQTGCIEVRGDQVAKSYLNDREADQVNFDSSGQWFKTGDIGYVNDSGLLFLVGRSKDVIKVWGNQVAPADLETILQSHAAVAEAAVIGIPHEILGEAPRAFVVLKRKHDQVMDVRCVVSAIHKYVNENVAEYKQLVGGIAITDSLPKIGAIRKIDRKKLQSMVVDKECLIFGHNTANV